MKSPDSLNDCTHNKLRFGSGDYYIFCAECNRSWRPDGEQKYNTGKGQFNSGHERISVNQIVVVDSRQALMQDLNAAKIDFKEDEIERVAEAICRVHWPTQFRAILDERNARTEVYLDSAKAAIAAMREVEAKEGKASASSANGSKGDNLASPAIPSALIDWLDEAIKDYGHYKRLFPKEYFELSGLEINKWLEIAKIRAIAAMGVSGQSTFSGNTEGQATREDASPETPTNGTLIQETAFQKAYRETHWQLRHDYNDLREFLQNYIQASKVIQGEIPLNRSDAINQLKAVLCDPEGTVCIEGSQGDRDVIQFALKTLEREYEPDENDAAIRHFSMLWHEYALQPDEKLTKGARELKQKLLAAFPLREARTLTIDLREENKRLREKLKEITRAFKQKAKHVDNLLKLYVTSIRR